MTLRRPGEDENAVDGNENRPANRRLNSSPTENRDGNTACNAHASDCEDENGWGLGQPRRHKVAYFMHTDVPNFHYGPNHPMKPHRLALTDALVHTYGLDRAMDCAEPPPATTADLLRFHAPEYIAFLDSVTHDTTETALANTAALAAFDRFNFAADCPAFSGLARFCRLYTGASLAGARALAPDAAHSKHHVCAQNDAVPAPVAINWSGGLHHAKRAEASGFCYVNDIVLAILELLAWYPRVMYVDIDVHHGDGVQDAFATTDRVMTVSFHKHGDGFFPGTGDIDDIGVSRGKYYAVNVPLRSGIDDAAYAHVFEPIMAAAVEAFDPSVIVLQGGADSLAGDRLGCFNLSIRGHGACVRFVQSLGRPVLMLGGGGYTIRNVARCWAYETSLLAGKALAPDLPVELPYRYQYAPAYKLHPTVHLDTTPLSASGYAEEHGHGAAPGSGAASFSGANGQLDNFNTRQYLDAVKATVLERIRRLQGAPSPRLATVPRLQDFLDEAAELTAQQKTQLSKQAKQQLWK